MEPSAPDPAPAPAPPPIAQPGAVAMSFPTVYGEVRITRGAAGFGLEMPGGEIAGKIRMTMNPGSGGQPASVHLASSGIAMKALAQMLSIGLVGRPVVDMTGLTGAYEVALDVSMEEALNVARSSMNLGARATSPGDAATAPAGAASDPSGTSSIFASIQNLGLKLEPRKAPLDLLVIDHIEKTPTGN
jgi:uncharacterized protein (TIGR03435 family)